MSGVGRAAGLWAITTHFNPAGFRRRLLNHREFRRRLGVPLLTVELSFDGRFELDDDDAELVVRITGGDVMWQKERLLNVALAHLPAGCETVAWIDADVIFEQADWPVELERALGRFALVQLLRCVRDLPRGASGPCDRRGASAAPVESTASRLARGADVIESLRRPAHRSAQASANGLAWAARRELLETHGFYDACILGSGDRAMVGAAAGAWETVADALLMSPPQRRHFRRWAEAFHAQVAGRVGCLDGTVHHLWHGRPERRRLGTRYRALEPHGFDPSDDLTLHPEGSWQWGSHKPALHRAVSEYFPSRREDD